MMRNMYGVIIAVVMFISWGCAATAPRHMAFQDEPVVEISAVKPEDGKAALVVVRTTKYGGAVEFDTYLDKQMIGVTQWKSYFIKPDVSPGVHYVISVAENMETAKINFEPGRVYYVHQSPRMGAWKARVSIDLETPDEVMKEFDDGCRLVVYDPADAGDDLSDEDYAEAVADYEREVQEGYHKEHEGYRGVAAPSAAMNLP